MRRSIFGLLPFIWLTFAVITTESRSINRTIADDAADEDFDLENALSDYYDNLMEFWGLEQETGEKQEEEEGEEEGKIKPKREEFAANYHPEFSNESENNTKSYYDLTIPIQIGNITYRLLNTSHAAFLDRQRINRERDTVEGKTKRIKNLRLSSIKDSVLGLRGGNSSQGNIVLSAKQTRTLKELFEKQGRGNGTWLISNAYTEKSLSFFPSCEIPKSTDEAVWSEPNSMNLFFDVYFPAPQKETALMIVNAALKVYTVGQTGFSFMPGNFTDRENDPETNGRSGNVPNHGLAVDDDKRIRVSVYWHTRSLRRQRIKKKLLDSQMLPLNGENSLTFDIRPAVRSWKESGKNFGLQIIVEDDNGTLLRPNDYIYPMNCSKFAATVKPLPLFGFDSVAQYFLEDAAVVEDSNKSVNEINADDQDSLFSSRPVKYPILGLQMRDVSLSEIQNLVKLKSFQMEMIPRNGNNGQRSHGLSDSSDSSKDSSFRITDFENVPLGFPLNRNFSSKPTQNIDLKSVAE